MSGLRDDYILKNGFDSERTQYESVDRLQNKKSYWIMNIIFKNRICVTHLLIIAGAAESVLIPVRTCGLS